MSKYTVDPIINVEAIQRLQQELGKLFEGEWVRPASGAHNKPENTAHWTPATDVFQNENAYQYVLELAGVALAEIEVSVHRGVLCVSGEKAALVPDTFTPLQTQAMIGRFEKHITLPDDVDEASLAATMHNGLLTVSVKRNATTRARRIPVSEVC